MSRLVLVFLLFLISIPSQSQRLRSNIALGLTSQQDSILIYNLNLGLFNSVRQLKGAQIGVFTAVTHKEMSGLNIAGIFAGSWGNARGAQIGGLGAISQQNLQGLQIATLTNFIRGDLSGWQIAGAMNATAGRVQGLQTALVSNVASHLQGAQISVATNQVGPGFHGAQITGIVNVATNVHRGLQFAGAMNITSGRMFGLQVAPFNFADTLNGIQVGLINIGVRHPKGAQIGVLNIGGDTTSFRLAFVNIDTHTKVQLLGGFGTSTKFNLYARFLNRRTYSTLGIGTHYLGADKPFSGALYYRTGRHRLLSSKLRLTGDIGFAHIETFTNDREIGAERLYSLSSRIGLDYQRWQHLGFFIHAGFEHTRFYTHNKHYKSRPLIELGLLAF